MKFLFITLTGIMFSIVTYSQNVSVRIDLPIDEQTNLITYKEVVTQSGTKDELYNRSMQWIKETYINPSGVTKISNKGEGKIIGMSAFKLYSLDKKGTKVPGGSVGYTFIIELKDGRYRYSFTEFNLTGVSKFPLERWLNEEQFKTPQVDYHIEQVDANTKLLIESLKTGMRPKKEFIDNW